MTIEIKEGGYYLGFWFLEGYEGNFLAAVYRIGDEPLKLVYRFRYFVDDKVHDSDDVKNWYSARFAPDRPEDEIVDVMNGMLIHLKAGGYCRLSEEPYAIIVKGDHNAAFAAMQGLPFWSAKQMPAKGAE